MKAVWTVAAQEVVVNVRRPGFIVMTILFPALGLIALLIGSLFGGSVGQALERELGGADKPTGYVDLSGLLSAELPQYEGRFAAYPSEGAARADLLAEKIDTYLVVPVDFLANGNVQVYGIRGGFSTMTSADRDRIQPFLADHLLTGRIDPEIQARASGGLNIQPVTLTSDGEVSSESAFNWLGDFVLPYAFSLLFLITVFTTSGYLLESVSEEKEGRIVEILLSSISPTQLLAGKILGLGAVGLLQVFIWLGSAVALVALATAAFALVGAIRFTLGALVLFVVYYLLGYLLYATLMAAAGSLGTTQRESQQLGSIFSLIAVIPWMLISVVFSNPNATIAIVLSYIPLTAPVMMILRLGFAQVPPMQIAISLVLLIIGLVISLWAGAKVFRMGILMYGKRPGLRQLWLAFRQA
ncbi:MAG TPA: ABC transporter permease [Anaerolineae bacterium]|nr:ABC transporter permease [Anaerolineae bacterium]